MPVEGIFQKQHKAAHTLGFPSGCPLISGQEYAGRCSVERSLDVCLFGISLLDPVFEDSTEAICSL